MFEINKNVPIENSRTEWPFRLMAVGESVNIHNKEKLWKKAVANAHNIGMEIQGFMARRSWHNLEGGIMKTFKQTTIEKLKKDNTKNLIWERHKQPYFYGIPISWEESRHTKRLLDMATDELLSAFICRLLPFETVATIAFHIPRDKQNEIMDREIRWNPKKS